MTNKKQQPIRKAVIPAAGLGTRFLPATKSVPKELLPIVDTPTIQYIVQEVVEAGVDTVILITGRGKAAIEDHFDFNIELQEKLEDEGKIALAKRLNEASAMVKMVSIRQNSPRGLGHAVLCAKDIVGNEPFLVVLGDDLVDATIPCSKQMIDIFIEHHKPVVALMPVNESDISKFGICGGKKLSDRLIEIDKMVEKPVATKAPSNLAIVGRYILTPEIFEILGNTAAGAGGEIQLTDAMAVLMGRSGFLGYQFEGKRYDAGDKFGFLQANIAYALKNPEIAPRLIRFMKELLKTAE